MKKNKKLIRIGIQGGKGSFNEEALHCFAKGEKLNKFSVEYLYTTKRVLKALHEKKIDRGLFAIQNSLGGTVWETINAMSEYNCKILKSFSMHISHFLLAPKGVKLHDIKTVYSHPQAFAQTEKTFKRRFPKIKRMVGKGILVDQATASRELSKGKFNKNTATLASRSAGEAYGLSVIAGPLEDKKPNITTFLFVSRFNKKGDDFAENQ